MQRILFKLYAVGLLFSAGLMPAQGQSSVSELRIPEMDRLPSWYFEQAPGQVLGISLSASQGRGDIEYEQAVCFALMRAALQQSDTNVVIGEVSAVRVSSQDGQEDVVGVSATLRIPINYIVLDQCRLKNGTVLVLLQYQYRHWAATAELEFAFETQVRNDSVNEFSFIRKDGEFEMECHSEYGEDGLYWVLLYTHATPFMFGSVAIDFDFQQYGQVMHNEYLLDYNRKKQGYLGWMYFDALRRDLYRKLIYRERSRPL